MTNQIADRLVHCRFAVQPTRALMLSTLLGEMEREGADPAALAAIVHAVARHGFHCGRHKGGAFAVFEPAEEQKPAAHLLILVRDGGVHAMLADQALETTVIDYDSARAEIGVALPDHVPSDDFNHIRASVIAEFLANQAAGTAVPANDAVKTEWKTAASEMHAQPWR